MWCGPGFESSPKYYYIPYKDQNLISEEGQIQSVSEVVALFSCCNVKKFHANEY